MGGKDHKTADKLAKEVVERLAKETKGAIPTVEQVQDLVEKTLIENGHAKTAKAYILYRKQHEDIRKAKSVLLNINKTMDGYIQQSNWRVNENSNIGYSFSGLLMHVAGAVIANYTLENIYSKEVRGAHKSGDFHIHDLSLGINPYCAGWSLKQLLYEGFNKVPGKIESAPPKHLDTALGQMVNFLGTLQNEWGGAMAFSSFDTYLAPFVRKDRLCYKKVKQAIQQFVFNMNVPSRWGGQTSFFNVTLDWVVPEDLKNQKVIIGGKLLDSNYADYQYEIDMVNKAFLEVMTEGDMHGRIFTFPIPTYNITKDFNWESENSELLFGLTAKYGLPYFQNFVNSSLKPSDVRAMCCRLSLDLRELRNKTGGLFGSGEQTGSLGVVTINMPRLAYLAKNETRFFERLERLMNLAMQSLETKRKVVESNVKNGLLPFTKRYLGTLNNHFSTVGLCGMNEACLNMFGQNMGHKDSIKFALRTLNFMREKLKEYQEKTANLYNLEATPAEGSSYRFAKLDKHKYPKIITSGNKEPFYTNSTALPVNYTEDIFEALGLQDELQCKYTAGTVFHCFLGERLEDSKTCQKLVNKISHNFKLPYFSITPTFSICQDHGYLTGEQPECPKCKQPTEIWSRVVGYHRPVSQWNNGKKEEFRHRLEFVHSKATNTNL